MSGGEVQRLGLARAFAHAGQARLLILDDATSSLDTATEMLVSRALTDQMSGRTRLIVAHRATSPAARADLVAWLDRGRLRALAPRRGAVGRRGLPRDFRDLGRTHADPQPADPQPAPSSAGRRLAGRLVRECRRSRRLPPGWAIAEAVGQFLAGRTADGLGWLGLLALAALAGAYGTRQTYLRLGAIVEPLRDELVELIVAGALARSADTARPPDTHAVARMTHQAEIVRDSCAGRADRGLHVRFDRGQHARRA